MHLFVSVQSGNLIFINASGTWTVLFKKPACACKNIPTIQKIRLCGCYGIQQLFCCQYNQMKMYRIIQQLLVLVPCIPRPMHNVHAVPPMLCLELPVWVLKCSIVCYALD